MAKGDKFLELRKLFHKCEEDTVSLTFDEMEHILGFKMCQSAYNHKEYWYSDNTHTFTDIWLNEGFKLHRIDLANKIASFVKVETPAPSPSVIVCSKPTIDVDFIIAKAKAYYYDLANDKNGRYISWEHCFSHFTKYRGKLLDEETLDILCLHLSFYLASWGMYRGSSFLIQKDYRVHKDVAIELFKDTYSALWSASCKILMEYKNLVLIFQLAKKIEDIYIDKRSNIDNRSSVSDILITKILMGTLGCVPAYDRFFIEGIRQYKVASGTFNSESIRSLADFYLKNNDKFENIRLEISSHGLEYPPMKIIDMSFWEIGIEHSTLISASETAMKI